MPQQNLPHLCRTAYRIFAVDIVFKEQYYIEKQGHGNPYGINVIHEIIDNSLISQINIEAKDIDIEGTQISVEGNLKYSLGMVNLPLPQDPLIFTANVQSKDRWWLGCAGLIIGGIIAIITGIVSGAIEVDKFWHIINPFWK